ncbi:MAG: putative rRNA maturation factor [Myxococcota bacterium]|jgi:probable rRNA maturation factor
MTSNHSIAVNVNHQIDLQAFDALQTCDDAQFVAVVNLCFATYAPQHTSVEICLMGEAEHTLAHEKFLKDSSATDVMAFHYDDSDCCGELLVNVEMAMRRAPEFSHTAIEELLLYVVHGTLHLLGFDDHQADDIHKMRAAESEIMQQAKELNVF